MSERELCELVRKERSRYAREWRAKNPSKVAAINKRYWEKKAMERLRATEEQRQEAQE